MSQQFQTGQPSLLFIRFEQGRGKGGVPKVWMNYPGTDAKPPNLSTIIHSAVRLMRALCEDSVWGHSKDLMPGHETEYLLHNVDGALINEPKDIVWEQVMINNNAHKRAELVLTWGLPSERLMKDLRASES